jgi:hypothetical protein
VNEPLERRAIVFTIVGLFAVTLGFGPTGNRDWELIVGMIAALAALAAVVLGIAALLAGELRANLPDKRTLVLASGVVLAVGIVLRALVLVTGTLDLLDQNDFGGI